MMGKKFVFKRTVQHILTLFTHVNTNPTNGELSCRSDNEHGHYEPFLSFYGKEFCFVEKITSYMFGKTLFDNLFCVNYTFKPL